MKNQTHYTFKYIRAYLHSSLQEMGKYSTYTRCVTLKFTLAKPYGTSGVQLAKECIQGTDWCATSMGGILKAQISTCKKKHEQVYRINTTFFITATN